MTSHFKKYVLPSGLRIMLSRQPQSLATTVLVLVEAGSEYESKGISGLSHFLEHLCFKGTKKRPTALAIASELESIGAVYNAFTGQEVTGYFAKASSDKNDQILDLVSDLYQNPVFDEKEMEKEKGVVIEEINLYEDMPMRKVQELFTQLVYGDQPAGWPIGGRKEIIRSLTKKDVLKYRSAHYVAKATVVAAAGAFDEKKMLEKIKKSFAGVTDGKKFGKPVTKESQKKPQSLVHFKKSDQTHLVLGFRAFNRYDKRRYALELLSDIMGGGMSSRLFQRVREQLGAAYYVRCETSLGADHGLFSVSAGIDHKKLEEVVRVVLEEFRRVASEPVPQKELQKSKNHLGGRLLIGLETSDELASFYGEQEIFKEKITDPKAMVRQLEAVTAKDILSVAKTVLKDANLNLALVGPFKELPKSLNLSVTK